jgi:hypothetical protein
MFQHYQDADECAQQDGSGAESEMDQELENELL